MTTTVTEAPPVGIHTYLLALELSDETNRGRFRFRLADDYIDPTTGLWKDKVLDSAQMRDLPTWHCERIGGQMYILHADPDSFFIAVRCEMIVTPAQASNQIDVYAPYGEELETLDGVSIEWANEKVRMVEGVRYDYENIPQEETQWRLCADKTACAWRLRDERTNDLWYVNDYRGLANAVWHDGGTHIFHRGPLAVDDYGNALMQAVAEDD